MFTKQRTHMSPDDDDDDEFSPVHTATKLRDILFKNKELAEENTKLLKLVQELKDQPLSSLHSMISLQS